MLKRLVPAVVLAVLLVTSPVVAVAAVPQEGAGGGDGGASGSAGGSASGSAGGSAEAGGGAAGGASTTAANGTRTIAGVGGIMDAARANDGGRYVVGALGFQGQNSTVARVAPNGSIRWTREFGGPNESSRVTAVATGDSPGAFLLEVGGTPGPGTDDTPPELRLSRITADGDLAWRRSLGNATSFFRGPVMAATDDGVVLARTVDSEPPGTRVTRFARDGAVYESGAYIY
jgi:hypothetical protein